MSLDLAAVAEIVDEAARTGTAIQQLSHTLDQALTVDDAYIVQDLSMQRRFARGEKLVGIKMGFTSRAKMRQMGLDELIWGRLTSGMRLEDGGTIELSKYVHPRVEPEVAFLLDKPLSGAVSPAEALSCVAGVAPAIEVIDSRYQNFKFSLTDVIADNSSSSGFVLGQWAPPEMDLSNLGMVVEINGKPVQIGSSAAILGHPVRSLVAAARVAHAAGIVLQPGWIVMAGGATAAEYVHVGDRVRLSAEDLGHVNLRVEA